MGRDRSYEPKDIAAERFARNRRHDVCSNCEEKIDRRYGCACSPNDQESIRRAERRNEEVLNHGYWSAYDSLTEY